MQKSFLNFILALAIACSVESYCMDKKPGMQDLSETVKNRILDFNRGSLFCQLPPKTDRNSIQISNSYVISIPKTKNNKVKLHIYNYDKKIQREIDRIDVQLPEGHHIHTFVAHDEMILLSTKPENNATTNCLFILTHDDKQGLFHHIQQLALPNHLLEKLCILNGTSFALTMTTNDNQDKTFISNKFNKTCNPQLTELGNGLSVLGTANNCYLMLDSNKKNLVKINPDNKWEWEYVTTFQDDDISNMMKASQKNNHFYITDKNLIFINGMVKCANIKEVDLLSGTSATYQSFVDKIIALQSGSVVYSKNNEIFVLNKENPEKSRKIYDPRICNERFDLIGKNDGNILCHSQSQLRQISMFPSLCDLAIKSLIFNKHFCQTSNCPTLTMLHDNIFLYNFPNQDIQQIIDKLVTNDDDKKTLINHYQNLQYDMINKRSKDMVFKLMNDYQEAYEVSLMIDLEVKQYRMTNEELYRCYKDLFEKLKTLQWQKKCIHLIKKYRLAYEQDLLKQPIKNLDILMSDRKNTEKTAGDYQYLVASYQKVYDSLQSHESKKECAELIEKYEGYYEFMLVSEPEKQIKELTDKKDKTPDDYKFLFNYYHDLEQKLKCNEFKQICVQKMAMYFQMGIQDIAISQYENTLIHPANPEFQDLQNKPDKNANDYKHLIDYYKDILGKLHNDSSKVECNKLIWYYTNKFKDAILLILKSNYSKQDNTNNKDVTKQRNLAAGLEDDFFK